LCFAAKIIKILEKDYYFLEIVSSKYIRFYDKWEKIVHLQKMNLL